MVTNNSCDYSPTHYNVQTGGLNGLLNNVAPSSTSGIPLISQGSSSQPLFGTAAIAGGGTNSTSFTQTNGILTYNGTSLVNYAGPQLSTAGIYTNTSQPLFSAYLGSSIINTTGDGTAYTIVYDTTLSNVGSAYSTSTGLFTAPVTGNYLISYFTSMQTTSAWTSNSAVYNSLVINGTAYYQNINIGSFAAATIYQGLYSIILPLSATNTIGVQITATTALGTKNTTINAGGINRLNMFSVALLC